MDINLHIAYSTTGLVFALVFVSLGLFAVRFYKHWKREQNELSQFFFLGFSGFTIFALIHAIGGLFFADNAQVLRATLSISAFFRGFSLTCFSYLIFYMFRSKISPWIGFCTVAAFALLTSYLSIIDPYVPVHAPFLDHYRSINWGTQAISDNANYALYALILIPLTIIFAKQLKSDDYYIKNRAFGFMSIFGIGILTTFFSFFMKGPIGADIATFTSSIIILIFFFATRRKNPPMDKRLT